MCGILFLGLSLFKTWLAFQPGFPGVEHVLLFLHKLVVLSGLIFAWYGCDRLVKWCMERKWFVWLSAFSFMIYVLHAPLVVYANQALNNALGYWPYHRLFTFIVLPLMLIGISVLFGAFLRKLFPAVYSFLTGGRGLK
ncbi:MAG: hypothetical protein IPI66_13180 [Chitinophagaceae bacterium]|nr:hypothetical protein [Chitinophagaceae bacterium]